MKVFVVTSGEYSDYGINAIFSTKEKAEGYVKMMEYIEPYEYYYINEWEVDKVCKNVEVDLCMINGEIKTIDDVCDNGATHEIYEAYDMKNDYSSKVIEITKEEVDRCINENHDDEFDKSIKFPVYVVRDVKYNPDFSVMKKIVFDEIAKYKAEKQGL